MSAKRRVASAVLRVAGVALAAGVFSASLFGVAPPIPALALGAPFSHQQPPHTVVVPRASGSHTRSMVGVVGNGAAAAGPVPSARGLAVLVALLVVALFVAWPADFARKASRTRGQPIAIA
jgi:hypothetical protein